MRGFGLQGNYSLYVPSPISERKINFKKGKPTIEIVGTCLEIPLVLEARNKVLACVARRFPLAELFADLVLVEYSAAVLNVNYKLCDDDLTMLHAGRAWREPMIVHAVGGVDAIKALREMSPERISQIIFESDKALETATMLSASLGVIPQMPVFSVESKEVAEIVAAGETLDDFDPTNL